MPEPLDDKTTVDTDETTPESSTETKSDSQEEPEKDGQPAADKKEGKDQESGKPDDSDEKTPKPDKDGRIQVRLEQFERLKRQKSELTGELDALREVGIDSKDHAEALRRDADNYHFILDQLGEKPGEFFADLQKAYPKALEEHNTTTIQAFLSLASDAYRRQGDTEGLNTAEVLESVRKTISGQQSRKSSEGDSSRGEQDALAKEKWEMFSDHVTSERDKALSSKIDELLPKGTEFKSPKQREKFISGVIDDVLGSLGNDTVFRRELAYAEKPQRGLSKSQREEAVKVYTKYALLHDSKRIRAAIAEQASLLNIAVAANGKDGKPAPQRREASSSGAPSSGPPSTEEKARIRAEVEKMNLSGTDRMAEYLRRITRGSVRA